MLNLNYLNVDIEHAKKEHVHYFTCYVNKRLFGTECQVSSTNTNHPSGSNYCVGINNRTPNSANINLLKDFVREDDKLKVILGGRPEELVDVNSIFTEKVDFHFGKGTYETYINLSPRERTKYSVIHDFFKDVNAVFNYSRLGEDGLPYDGYKLTSNLGVRTCVYCNRVYALTHKRKSGGKLLRPQLDHWFPQSKYPLLQISFFNLIPSCDICNSRVKNDLVFDLISHHHPYQETEENIQFNYRPIFGNKQRVYFTNDSDKKIKHTCEELLINEMYEGHQSELVDLILTKKKYSKAYLDILKNSFPEANLNKNEIYRLAFGVELDKKEFHKRPFSKFKYDILKELKIIED